jgi:hypothetical protein
MTFSQSSPGGHRPVRLARYHPAAALAAARPKTVEALAAG